MSVSKFYKIISPRSPNTDITDSQDVGGNRGLYGNYTWYHRLVQGSASRITRYREFDLMDNDIDVSRALNIITDEIVGNNSKTKLPLEIQLTTNTNEQKIPSTMVITLNAALKTWCKLQKWDTRIFILCRNLIKYGDVFFYRPKIKSKQWIYVHPKNVIGAIVTQDDITDVKGWHIKIDGKRAEGGTSNNTFFNSSATLYDYNVEVFNADEIIRFTLNSDMTDEAPFGTSILTAIYKTFKQKELLEDSILIYRIVRAPERRVFYIDTGKMPAHKVAAHLEQIKNEIKQKKIPSMFGGKSNVESVYNPQSMSEDFFFSIGANGQGSRVETLPGGQGLGELQDLEYFYRKLWRGLQIPQSYMDGGGENAQFNDGAVGIAYMQEIQFTEYAERLQRYVEIVMDIEFKRFLYDMNLNIDPTMFKIALPEPTNWAKSRQQKMDADTTGVYTSIAGQTEISKRMAQMKYLQWSQEDVLLNERMLREEKGLDPNGGINDLPKLYYPEEAEAGGFEGGLGNVGGGSGGLGGGEGDLGLEGEDGTPAEGEEGAGTTGNEGSGETKATPTPEVKPKGNTK